MCVPILGAVHLGTPGVGIVDGVLALARRLMDFFDLPIPIPYATQWKWFSRGWPIQNGANAESKPPMLYQISECVKCMCVCVMLMPKRIKQYIQYRVIFRVITAGVYQWQHHELMSTGINRIVVRGISDGQSWGTTCHQAISNRM